MEGAYHAGLLLGKAFSCPACSPEPVKPPHIKMSAGGPGLPILGWRLCRLGEAVRLQSCLLPHLTLFPWAWPGSSLSSVGILVVEMGEDVRVLFWLRLS